MQDGPEKKQKGESGFRKEKGHGILPEKHQKHSNTKSVQIPHNHQ
jgi:hypothetical protein